MPNPPTGWIPPAQRTQKQMDAHVAAVKRMQRFTLPFKTPPKGTKVILTDFWKKPEATADFGGQPFTGFRQLTGSCVGASAGNWVTTLSCVQTCLTEGATKAFIAFWPFFYGRTRFNEGDRGQGEGAVDSVMGDTIAKEGYFDIIQPGLPTFDTRDGLCLTERIELEYSDGNSSSVTKWMALAKQHLGAKAPLSSADDIAASILNGYPVIDGDELYCSHGSVQGSGADAYVRGKYDGRGGHSTCFLGYWNHPNDGDLFLYSNQWDGSTYPNDPAGAGRCCVWMPRSEVDNHFRSQGGGDGETINLSHVDWFPEQQDKILDHTQYT